MQRLEALLPDATEFRLLPGAGSNRRYWRVTRADGSTVIATLGTDRRENEAFIYLSGHFTRLGLPVPRVLAVSPDGMAYVQEDLGDTSLLQLITDQELVRQAITTLPKFQISGALGVDFSRCYPVAEMDRRSVMWDLNYFKYCFLKLSGLELDEPRLENEFELLADHILQARPWGFMVRDFQSRNVMVHDGRTYLIDFQGGRRGPVHYDVASFLWQARAGFTPEQRSAMVQAYVEAAHLHADEFGLALPFFVVFRMLQVLGAYGFRGLHERKSPFLSQIPAALANLRQALSPTLFPYLCELAEKLTALYPAADSAADSAEAVLTVEVMSFSYRKDGYPRDTSGNGGGFAFDCRYLHNPGRFEQYKALTGRDEPVIKFLEEKSEIGEFLSHAWALADAAVERYLERGFSHLQLSFGCTGGRHRSVYSAWQTAEHLRAKFAGRNIHVIERHLQQPQFNNPQ